MLKYSKNYYKERIAMNMNKDYYSDNEGEWIKGAGLLILAFGVIVMMVGVFVEALDREGDRRNAVEIHNCKHYGAAINKNYGRDHCPPTPHG